MCLLTAGLLFSLLGFTSCVQFEASLNMGGVTGNVVLDSDSQMASVNVTGAGSCSALNFSLSIYPVKFGHYDEPCAERHIGVSIFEFEATPIGTVNVTQLFQNYSNLDDFSLTLKTCNGIDVCTVVTRSGMRVTQQARFTGPIAGNVYIRFNKDQTSPRVLTDLVSIGGVSVSQPSITLFGYMSTDTNCMALLGSLNSSALTDLGVVKVGSPSTPMKSRLDLSSFNYGFLLYKMNSSYKCAMIYTVASKKVRAVMNMKGIKGHFSFSQPSPFDVTEVKLNLTGLGKKVGPYHVHLFPVPPAQMLESSQCSNDNVGGHWNPFKVNTGAPTYPNGPGQTHDMYEIGDLSNKHMSLTNKNDAEGSFIDYHLPLFGQNSIVGRSIVIHLNNGSRYVCASIGYPGEVVVSRARFHTPVVGDIWFSQLKDNPLSDVSIFMDLAYGNPSTTPTKNHNWHVHTYPISSANDNDVNRCNTAGGHWNPVSINTTDSSYARDCGPSQPFSCEVGDLSNKHSPINLFANPGKVEGKNFFTDVTSWLSGSGITGRSVVIHEANRGGPRIACANVTMVQVSKASLGTWFGPGMTGGQIRFSQAVPQGPTSINVSLMNLNAVASGYHVHILPILPGSKEPCSDANILGHFNPLGVNISNSPEAGTGTVDQYEIGDISGKFGLLTGLNELQDTYMDQNMPLTGRHSIVGRSVVVHYPNGSRMQCADIKADMDTGGHMTIARASFSGAVTGMVMMYQQIFPTSSDEVMIEVNLQSAMRQSTSLSMAIRSNRVGTSNNQCNSVGDVFNPFNMPLNSSNCSPETSMYCAVGEVSERHEPISQMMRQVFTDSLIRTTGDNSVVHRSLVLSEGENIIACADILPESPSAEQTFPTVTEFNRYDFRKRVANVLQLDMSRVTILSGSPFNAAVENCQTVNFMVSGTVSSNLLNSVKTSPMMGVYRESVTCTGNAGLLLLPGSFLLYLTFAAACLLPSLLY
ncbi:uncharacterized protein cusr [Halichoeres trimaculatus]|uniref:uncharacterized protein cusr n=1 Tax=Halichoeres trimaculatus TaxID=147232 RepID=UPI003D9E0C15